MKTKTNILKVVVYACIVLLITNCNKKEVTSPTNNPATNNPTVPVNPYTPPAVTFKSTVRGFVQDLEGNYIQNAVVSTGNQTFTTDEDGMFELVNASFTGDFCYIKVQKQGFFTASTTVHGKAGSEYEINLVMVAQNNIHSFKATEAKTIALPSGAKVDFPANAIKELDGTPYTGQVNVAIDHIDPDDENFSLLIPGGDLRAYTAEGENAQLYSYGMLNVELRDDAGNYLQLVDGKKAMLTIPVPSNTEIAPPATIPLWYFDENKGVWIEEGKAKLQNGQYVGEVSHFTPWNADLLVLDLARVRGKFVDCEGNPIRGFRPSIGQNHLFVDDGGNFMKTLIVRGITRKLRAYSFVQKKYIDLNITIPPLSNNQVYDLGTIKLPCLTQVKANITDCDNKPFKGSVSMKIEGETTKRIIKDGNLSLALLDIGNKDIELTFKTANIAEKVTKTITLPANGKKLDLGTIKVCPSTQTQVYFSFDYSDGTTTKSVSFDNIEIASSYLYTPRPPATRPLIIQLKEFEWKRNLGSVVILRLKNSSLGKHPVDSVAPMSADHMEIYIPDKNTTSTGTNFHFVTISITLTEFGKVGEPVRGTFTGDCYVPSITSNVKITNGKFSVIRTQ
jgi:hypothetical protein